MIKLLDTEDGSDVEMYDLSNDAMNASVEIEEDFGDDPLGNKLVPTGCSGARFYMMLSSFWFAFAVVTGSLTSIVWPSQIATIVGEEHKEQYTGIVPTLGVFMALLVPPLTGAVSDHSTSPWGRRRPFIFVGCVITIICCLLSAPFKSGSSIWLFMLCVAGIQLGINGAGGPYSGMMYDLIHPSKLGVGSGVLGLATGLGFLVGAIVSGTLTRPSGYIPIYAALASIIFVFTVPTLCVKEKPLNKQLAAPLTTREFLRLFILHPKDYRDFYWVIITRTFQEMGQYSILPFFQFYLKDVVGVEQPEQWSSILIATIVTTSIPASAIAGPLSDRYGRKIMVYIASGIMAASTLSYIFLSFTPSLAMCLVIGAAFGIGYGAYQAVDWALALDVLPPGAAVAKDMGIWHIAMVLPQLISPVVSGMLLNHFKSQSLITGYAVVFAVATFWFFLATVFIYPVSTKKRYAHL